MPHTVQASTPLELITALVDARTRGDIDAAVAFFEPEATLIAQPGMPLKGPEAIRGFFETYVGWRPVFEVSARDIITTGDLALHMSAWTLQGTGADGQAFTLSGRTTDVFRRQPAGHWLVMIDNPWGTALLG
ncbi:MAG: hypothetical protein JWP29_2274 [Rhodoferax sp.]|nr:hypothetical protein [Rhodoferax sp.]